MKTAAFTVAVLLIVYPPLGAGLLAIWAFGWLWDKVIDPVDRWPTG